MQEYLTESLKKTRTQLVLGVGIQSNAIADVKKSLGDILSIRNAFIGFQEYLYEQWVGQK